jgi:hypothetical protein
VTVLVGQLKLTSLLTLTVLGWRLRLTIVQVPLPAGRGKER